MQGMARRCSARQRGLPAPAAAQPGPRQPARPRAKARKPPHARLWQRVPHRLAVSAALLDSSLQVEGTWPELSLRRKDVQHAMAFVAWRVLPQDAALADYDDDLRGASRLFDGSESDCLQPSPAKLLSQPAADLRGDGWLAGATCARTQDGRWFLQLRQRRPSAQRCAQVVKQLSGSGAQRSARAAQLKALLPKLLRGLTVHVHRLLCYLRCGGPPGGEQPLTKGRGSTLACHSCGRAACLNSSHLHWGTAAQNNAAKLQQARDRKDRLLRNLGCARCCSTCAQLARPPRCD